MNNLLQNVRLAQEIDTGLIDMLYNSNALDDIIFDGLSIENELIYIKIRQNNKNHLLTINKTDYPELYSQLSELYSLKLKNSTVDISNFFYKSIINGKLYVRFIKANIQQIIEFNQAPSELETFSSRYYLRYSIQGTNLLDKNVKENKFNNEVYSKEISRESLLNDFFVFSVLDSGRSFASDINIFEYLYILQGYLGTEYGTILQNRIGILKDVVSGQDFILIKRPNTNRYLNLEIERAIKEPFYPADYFKSTSISILNPLRELNYNTDNNEYELSEVSKIPQSMLNIKYNNMNIDNSFIKNIEYEDKASLPYEIKNQNEISYYENFNNFTFGRDLKEFEKKSNEHKLKVETVSPYIDSTTTSAKDISVIFDNFYTPVIALDGSSTSISLLNTYFTKLNTYDPDTYLVQNVSSGKLFGEKFVIGINEKLSGSISEIENSIKSLTSSEIMFLKYYGKNHLRFIVNDSDDSLDVKTAICAYFNNILKIKVDLNELNDLIFLKFKFSGYIEFYILSDLDEFFSREPIEYDNSYENVSFKEPNIYIYLSDDKQSRIWTYFQNNDKDFLRYPQSKDNEPAKVNMQPIISYDDELDLDSVQYLRTQLSLDYPGDIRESLTSIQSYDFQTKINDLIDKLIGNQSTGVSGCSESLISIANDSNSIIDKNSPFYEIKQALQR